MIEKLRNIAIIAHVDHGKTTLVDKLLQQTSSLNAKSANIERVMDSNDLEKERGITILAKNTAIEWNGYRINIVDTPGHADFGGEVERILSMVDSVLLLVDAVDGPMPQTRFVTQKAFEKGLKPIVVVNKIDRPGARPEWVIDQVFDLFDRLGATEEQLDFPVIYASALNGYAIKKLGDEQKDLTPLLEAVIAHVPVPPATLNGPLQLQISALDYSSYVGVIGIGRITRGIIKKNMPVSVIDRNGEIRQGKVLQIWTFKGLDRIETESAEAGDIVAIAGIDKLTISDTVCTFKEAEMLPPLKVDEPTISMTFQINDSPFVKKDGEFVTSRQLRDRLMQETIHNIALRVEETGGGEKFRVSGRGELHLGILIETMRREGFELAVSRPEVILKDVDGEKQEPYELLVVDVEEQHQGTVMRQLGERRAEMLQMIHDGKGRIRMDFMIATRSLIGFHNIFQTQTSGTGILTHVFDHYGKADPANGGRSRIEGVLISNMKGKATAFALFNLQQRGKFFTKPQDEVYEGMIVGIHSRENDLVVNPTKEKQLSNVRNTGSEENMILAPPIKLTLEYALEFIEDDELVEVTPKNIRLRKRYLMENERKKHSK
ncbi:MAG: translational GTPase TypA [Alphaproteobacteria bacterium]|nr:MAG: translational GTPase TypA [Alphaproteobacteria bacterium]